MASFMKNSDLHRMREQIRIKYANAEYIQWGKMVRLNEYPEYIYKEIGREVNIVIRYIEDIDVMFSESNEFTDIEILYTLNYLRALFSGTMNPTPDEMIKNTYYLTSKLSELKSWYQRLNSNLDTLLEDNKK